MKVSLKNRTLYFAERGKNLGDYPTVTAFIEAAVFNYYTSLVEKQQVRHGLWQKKQQKSPSSQTLPQHLQSQKEVGIEDDLSQQIKNRLESMALADKD